MAERSVIRSQEQHKIFVASVSGFVIPFFMSLVPHRLQICHGGVLLLPLLLPRLPLQIGGTSSYLAKSMP